MVINVAPDVLFAQHAQLDLPACDSYPRLYDPDYRFVDGGKRVPQGFFVSHSNDVLPASFVAAICIILLVGAIVMLTWTRCKATPRKF